MSREVTYPLCIRLPISVHAKYRELSPIAREYFKQIIIRILNEGKLAQINEVSILNMNLNININKNEVRPEINVTTGDPEVTREYVRTLEAEIKQLKRILQRKNEELKQLRKLLDKVRMFASRRDISSIRRVLGVSR